ncbi:cadherin-12-like isoform X2 [Dendropsophus ebraccatus]|uniref:cadherin-12-like isoform X2 n=1 Tax=Dendropsophus ebraccatus TaxID=150705 RepID=UPI003831F896
MLTRNCLSLLLWFLFDGGLLTPLHSQQPPQTSASKQKENVIITMSGRRSAAQRVKRGWVWNQFFVLEEYMGSEPQYVGKLHSDLDKGVGSVKYTLLGDGAGTVFTIDDTTGDIHAIKSLDREEKPFYTLRAQAVDIVTGKPVEPESEFIIKVQDINDNEPKFLDGPYVANVPEMSPVGVIRTALPNMDREVKEQYQVLIQAKDMGGQLGGLAGTTTVNITLTDVNDNPPRFPKSIFHLKVPESSQVGSPIGRIRAVDPDFGKNAEIEYNIVPGDGGNLFDIITDNDTQEGILMLKKPLDFETKKAYTFKVEASNVHLDHHFNSVGPFKDTATVKINVLDVDEPPVFSKPSYTMEVYEDTPVGTIIGAVTAQDLDIGSSPVRYYIDEKSDLDNNFSVNPIEGTISTNELLDRESTAQFNISIIASKISNPQLTSSVKVIINVLDVNEFAPEVTIPYETSVCENAKPRQIIQIIGAVDRDMSPTGQKFSFRLPPDGLTNPNFTVHDYKNNSAGIEAQRHGYSRRDKELYLLPVVVEDSSYPIQSSTSTLTIRVCRCDSRGAILSCNVEAIFLPVGLSTGALIAILLCIIILLVIVVLYVALRRQKKKDALMTSKEDIRDNVIHYDDEGGGEEDTQAFDIGALRNPKVIDDNKGRRDIKPEPLCLPRHKPAAEYNSDIRDFINERLQEHDVDPNAPPYDSLATYAYEGSGSVAESLSSIESPSMEIDQDYDFLSDWGPQFKSLAEMFGGENFNTDKIT